MKFFTILALCLTAIGWIIFAGRSVAEENTPETVTEPVPVVHILRIEGTLKLEFEGDQLNIAVLSELPPRLASDAGLTSLWELIGRDLMRGAIKGGK